MEENKSGIQWLSSQFNAQEFQNLHREMSFSEYIEAVKENPKLVRNAPQRLYDMIMEKGSSPLKRFRKTYTHYNFFDNPELPIFGLESSLDELVKIIRGAAGGYGTEKRILLLHGPVGSSKSTICRLLKRGLEDYSRTEAGTFYTYKWVDLPVGAEGLYTQKEDRCPMNDDPLRLIPIPIRNKFLKKLNETLIEQTPEADRTSQYTLKVEGELNPRCKYFMEALLKKYNGNWEEVVEKHIKVIRLVASETDRVTIATFQPKDEKNQDATELTGDINYAKISHFGADSDPRAFNFDGEFCVANRGCAEFIEILKLEKAFLYDLLGASQEKSIKPKKFAQITIDTVLISHTNHPEYVKLCEDPTMEAFRDRTVKIDIPYLTRLDDEIAVLKQDYNPDKVKQHIAPHTIEIAALWAVLTRLDDDKDNKLTLVQKAKLYNGKSIHGYNEDSVKELKDKYPNEGMKRGVSARYVQDKISNCLSSNFSYINTFMVMNELRKGLTHSSLIVNEDDRALYIERCETAIKELNHILKNEVQKALVGDEAAIVRLCTNYIDNIMASINKTKIVNPYTGKDQEPDERLMRAIEQKIDVPEVGVPDFRRSVASFIGTLAARGEKFTWESNPQLKKALEAKLFEDTKDHIKLSSLNTAGAATVDADLQEKIDAIKQRMIKQYGYNDKSAEDVLNYVGSLFASPGDASDD